MATIVLTIPDAVLPRVIDALCADGGYDRLAVPDGETKPTKAQFAKRQVIAYVRAVVNQHEAQQAAETARATATAKAEAEVTIS